MMSFAVYIFSKFIGWAYFRLFYNLKVVGKENIPKKGAFLFASNHVSNFDPILLGISSPRFLYYLAKDSLFSTPFRRWYFKNIRLIPIRREGRSLRALKAAVKILRAGEPLVIFPEGTRSLSDTLQEAKRGIGFLVAKTRTPVVPVYVKGTKEVLPKGERSPRFHQITVCIGARMYFNGFLKNRSKNEDGYEFITKEVMSRIKTLKNRYNGGET